MDISLKLQVNTKKDVVRRYIGSNRTIWVVFSVGELNCYSMSDYVIRLIIVALIVFLVNIPFGMLRSREKRFSLKWFLYIHLPIPLVVLARIYGDIGFTFYTYPVLIGAFFLGQFVGRKMPEICPFHCP